MGPGLPLSQDAGRRTAAASLPSANASDVAGYPLTMSQEQQNLGRLDDDAEAQERSSTQDGPAAEGEYDPTQGSPHGVHPTVDDERTRTEHHPKHRAADETT